MKPLEECISSIRRRLYREGYDVDYKDIRPTVIHSTIKRRGTFTYDVVCYYHEENDTVYTYLPSSNRFLTRDEREFFLSQVKESDLKA